jgi:hypothetical protein
MRTKTLPVAAAALLACIGCTSRTVSNTPRTAVEQLLLSGAVDRALAKFDVPELSGKTLYADFTNLKAVDAEYVKVAARARFAAIGATLVDKAEDADYIAEVASGGLGTEFKESSVGLPAIPMPGSPTAFPELPIFKGVERTGLMKLLIFVHAKGKFVAAAHYYAACERDEKFVLFFRFQQRDDIREGWEQADLDVTGSERK